MGASQTTIPVMPIALPARDVDLVIKGQPYCVESNWPALRSALTAWLMWYWGSIYSLAFSIASPLFPIWAPLALFKCLNTGLVLYSFVPCSLSQGPRLLPLNMRKFHFV